MKIGTARLVATLRAALGTTRAEHGFPGLAEVVR